MLKLTKVGVGGFKSIKKLQPLELQPINVVVGANGSGKSNLLSFFRLLSAIAAHKLQEYVAVAGGAETLLYYGSKETPAMWAALEFTGKTGGGDYFFYLASTATDSLIFSHPAPQEISDRATKRRSSWPKRTDTQKCSSC